jgi:hypothetical protein
MVRPRISVGGLEELRYVLLIGESGDERPEHATEQEPGAGDGGGDSGRRYN